jgi:hypothetical protein
MRSTLFPLMFVGLSMAACSQPDAQYAVSAGVDTIIRVTRDTIIKHQAAGVRDTIIKYYSAVPECCNQVPRPPGCPPLQKKLMKVDTIIK